MPAPMQYKIVKNKDATEFQTEINNHYANSYTTIVEIGFSDGYFYAIMSL